MSIETRSSSALFKRAEQLKRWANSDTNREPTSPKNKSRKIKFSSGCVFLAACASGDKEEVTKLLQKGADINTANVDGLTALHQACIDDNLDMVEFLVGRGADVNRGDNEGWTSLHATASCGFESIAKYLLDNGADVAAINNDGELAIDIVEEHQKSMRELLHREIQDRGIDCDEARSEEERMMLNDAREWLNSHENEVINSQHPKTGATPLHVASAKGYIKVINILLQCKADLDKQDFDGWTPLHAASYWGQKEAATILVDNLADMDIKNYVGQTAFDVAVDTEMLLHLEDLKKRQNKNELMINKKQALKKNLEKSGQLELEETKPPKVKRVQLEIENSQLENNQINKDLTNNTVGEMEMGTAFSSDSESDSTESLSDSSESFSSSDIIINDHEKKNRANSLTDAQRIQAIAKEQQEKSLAKPSGVPVAPTSPPKQIDLDINADENEVTPSWRRPGSFKHNKNNATTENKEKTITPPETEVTLRRTQSFQSDPKFYSRYMELRERIKASSEKGIMKNNNNISNNNKITSKSPLITSLSSLDVNNISHAADADNLTLLHSFIMSNQSQNNIQSHCDSSQDRVPTKDNEAESVTASTATTVPTTTSSAATTPTKTTQPTSPTNTTQIRRSFVPPVRDEESETQRKKHAKRVRETRRSTQGVTLDEIKSAAEQLNINKQNQQPSQTANANSDQQSGANGETNTNTITAAIVKIPNENNKNASNKPDESNQKQEGLTESGNNSQPERRPSWRLRVDNGTNGKFKLEDASKTPETNVFIRKPSGVNSSNSERPLSAPEISPTATEATTTVTIRRPKSLEDKEQDKENDARNAQAAATLATQAAIQRRRRPKRRSTGVVHLDMDEMDPEKGDPAAGGDTEENSKNNDDSGSESNRSSSSRGSRLDLTSTRSDLASLRGENGELDYKKMYEQAISENDRLREKLRKSEEDLRETKNTLEKLQTVTSKNSLSELEKRERRAMERKLSEMEEELKQLEALKTENQRLKDENGALIRVISKLSK